MSDRIRREILPGVHLTALQTKKFKTSYLRVGLLTALTEKDASKNALLPMVLRRGTARYPDLESLSAALDTLYGGFIEPMVRKKGEIQCVGFLAGFLDDAFTPDGTPVLQRMIELVGDVLLRPATRNGRFYGTYVEGERTNLIDRIQAQINDKRTYAQLRLMALMCDGEASGIDKLGSEAQAAKIKAQDLYRHYQQFLATSQIELYYCGSAPFDQVERIFQESLIGLPRAAERLALQTRVLDAAIGDTPRVFVEALDVSQGKLVMGFRTGGVSIFDAGLPALLVFNAAFGGSTTSRLFMHVRERLSLCYYASSMVEKHKGLLLVSSGIAFPQFEPAKNEILAQWEAIADGQLETWELEAARRSVISTLETTSDSQPRLEDFYLGQAVGEAAYEPNDLALLVSEVTAEQVADMARRLSLDAIYFLKGQESADGEK